LMASFAGDEPVQTDGAENRALNSHAARTS
jgi:hypothetical protein